MSDFGKDVAKEERGLRENYANRPAAQRKIDGTMTDGIDKSVKEQVLADLDGLIKKHEG